ncbi:hypothetical protein GDN83_10895 [Gordonia jinghuaiqii]|uniref:YfhO family protein n=1 Tax=Gordonia jinghuaiqii TaxID=2758710 RepID=A0A7D7LTR3_9ACTN|nr:hypothetical protein [Gordonia jinghuaiqii]MCR5978230.1 hypothetical protein [Gordonia jinghuaiqii]QMT01321.1 hypothetical protein H1R19_21235 [Gordonia jinghuaiqii]
MLTRRLLPVLWLLSTGAAAAILAPLLPGLFGAGPRYLLYRDAVSTPRTHVTDTTLGIGDLPPRAVPQDWFVAMLSSVIDGGVVVTATLLAALVCAGVGYGRLAARLVPGAGRTGAAAAALISIWNPYVAERLLQGHWSLLVGYAALGWIVVAVVDLRDRPDPLRLLQLGGLLAVAGLTPTGSVLAGIVLAVTLLGRPAGKPNTAAAAALWVLSTLPWLVTALISDATTTSAAAGVEAFGLRSEPWLGPVGTVMSLGGIWNVDAVPASRTIGWAAVATLCLLVVVGVGARHLWRRRTELDPTVKALSLLAGVTAILLLLSMFGPVRSVMEFVVEHVGGGGLVRDNQKFAALLVPAFALAAGAAGAAARRRVPAGFALTGIALLIVAPLPDLAWGVGGSVRAVDYPREWREVAQIVPADHGAVALWPADTVRDYTFASEPALDPAARMMRAPVIESGTLTVDGEVIDPPGEHAAAVTRVLESGGSPTALAELGVGWVLVENGEIPERLAAEGQIAYAGAHLRLYRVDEPADRSASAADRMIATGAHVVWAGLIAAGLISLGLGARRAQRRRSRESRRTSRPTSTGSP